MRKARLANRLSGSRVVDNQGRLLVVYHATRSDFDEFDCGDLGCHFGSLESAHQRLQDRLNQGDAPGGERIMPVYLSIRRPLILPDAGDWDRDDAIATALGDRMLDDGALADAYEGAEALGGSFRDILERMGYDGIAYDNVGEGGGRSWICFRPEQIYSLFDRKATLRLARNRVSNDQEMSP